MAPPHRFVLVRPAGSRLSEGQTASGLRCHGSDCGPGPRPDPGRQSLRLQGVTGGLHSPGSPPGVALGWPSSPRAARSDLVEPPEETANHPRAWPPRTTGWSATGPLGSVDFIFTLQTFTEGCVCKERARIVCSAPRDFTREPHPCDPGEGSKRDPHQGPCSLPSSRYPSPLRGRPDSDFLGPGFRSCCSSSAPCP